MSKSQKMPVEALQKQEQEKSTSLGTTIQPDASSALADLYGKLQTAVKNLPPEAVERANKETTRKGYDMVGYQCQYLINVMNEVCGINGWGYSYEIVKEIEGTFRSGQKSYEVVIDLTIWIIDKTIIRTAPGGHQSSSYTDARKGALTNALKKTLSMFGIGKQAYEGTLDEDYQASSLPQMQEKPVSYSSSIFVTSIEKAKTKTGKDYSKIYLEDGRIIYDWDGYFADNVPQGKSIKLESIELYQENNFWKYRKIEKPVPTIQEETPFPSKQFISKETNEFLQDISACPTCGLDINECQCKDEEVIFDL